MPTAPPAWPLMCGVACAAFAVGLVIGTAGAGTAAYAPPAVRPAIAPVAPTPLSFRQTVSQPATPLAGHAGRMATEATASEAQATVGWAPLALASGLVGGVVAYLQRARPQEQMSLLAAAAEGPPQPLPMNCRSVARDEPGYRYLGSTEIPAPIPRRELIDSIQQWAQNELRENLEQRFFGFKLLVDYPDDRVAEEDAFSLTVRFVAPTGEYVVVEYCLDNEVVRIGRTLEGFAVEDKERGPFLDREGNADPRTLTSGFQKGETRGRTFMVRRKEGPLADTLRPILADFLKETSMALTRYYAFGSLFLDDAL